MDRSDVFSKLMLNETSAIALKASIEGAAATESRGVRRAQPGSLHLLRRRRQQHSDSEQLQFGSSRRSDLSSDLVLSVHFNHQSSHRIIILAEGRPYVIFVILLTPAPF